VDTRITGARPVESPRAPAPGRPMTGPPEEGPLLALTVAFVACVGAGLVAAYCHVVCWPAFLVLAFFVLLTMYDTCVRG
jgi:hypothetical protein